MSSSFTPRAVGFTASEEAIVPEAYKDAKGIWSWSMGLATTGGYDVLKYKDKPQPIVTCLRAAVAALQDHYLPAVLHAFAGRNLSENELAAALSFHWNTGAIGKAQWVKDVMAGQMKAAQADILQWSSGGMLTDRRKRESALFFDGAWPSPMTTLVFEVQKPSYRTGRAKRFDPLPTLQQIMGGQ
ncbi:MAG: hypothetical protein KGJ57_17360 [Sphingomonadales bacterium]|nr:hypothetical protein [Sphingomonadales bacterium]MDE2171166.1 hypothetical protein [Sphingomonadales bacterium]